MENHKRRGINHDFGCLERFCEIFAICFLNFLNNFFDQFGQFGLVV